MRPKEKRAPRNNELALNDKVMGEENVEHSEDVIQKAKRKKTSSVWEHFKEINLKNGTKIWEMKMLIVHGEYMEWDFGMSISYPKGLIKRLN
ncbi:unnamed protein product [Lupinus luteus]|uniref:Uncharacterized protein n=1 Tax=Lupinus luteus TaxID=3873 RepID=A0AAV1X0C9_LUPLU